MASSSPGCAPSRHRGNDEQKADDLAAIAGSEKYAFLGFARARATRLVFELAPLIASLVPVLLERLAMTGDDVEAIAIARLAAGDSAATLIAGSAGRGRDVHDPAPAGPPPTRPIPQEAIP